MKKTVNRYRNNRTVTLFVLSLILTLGSVVLSACSSLAPEIPASVDSDSQPVEAEIDETRDGLEQPGVAEGNGTLHTDNVEADGGGSGSDQAGSAGANIADFDIQSILDIGDSVTDTEHNVFSLHHSAELRTDTHSSISGYVALDLGVCESQVGASGSVIELKAADGSVIAAAQLSQFYSDSPQESTLSHLRVFGQGLVLSDQGCSRGWLMLRYEGKEPMWVSVSGADGNAEVAHHWPVTHDRDLFVDLVEGQDRADAVAQRLEQLGVVADFGQTVTVNSGPFADTQIEVHGWAELKDGGVNDFADRLQARTVGVDIEWCNVEGSDLDTGRPNLVLIADGWAVFEPLDDVVLDSLILTTPGSCSRQWLEFVLHNTTRPEAILLDFVATSEPESDSAGRVVLSLAGGAVADPQS